MDLSERRARQERRHPWETERARFFAREARLLAGGPARVLDVGSGDGFFAEKLVEALGDGTEVTCVDAAYTDADLAEELPAGLSRARALPSEAAFDGLVLLDVLEHVEDDGAFLRSALRLVRPGGWALVSVPAWQSLFSRHDERLLHFRRYRPSAGRRLLEEGGLRIERSGGLFASLVPPRVAQKALQVAGLGSEPRDLGQWTGGALKTGALGAVLRADAAACGGASKLGIEVPGTSWWAACRVP
jgi:SAM-dependent methyltransferase